ncbi:MAG TPA: hypothetical protein VHK86_01915 [Nitrososphaera sp.]|nr:hypothetical protein [Nitrososphaera sp.]
MENIDLTQLQALAFQIMVCAGLARPILTALAEKTATKTDDKIVNGVFKVLDLVTRFLPRAKVGK